MIVFHKRYIFQRGSIFYDFSILAEATFYYFDNDINWMNIYKYNSPGPVITMDHRYDNR